MKGAKSQQILKQVLDVDGLTFQKQNILLEKKNSKIYIISRASKYGMISDHQLCSIISHCEIKKVTHSILGSLCHPQKVYEEFHPAFCHY